MKKTIVLKMFAAAAVMVTGGIVLSPAASASSSPCPHNRICIFENAGFHGGHKSYNRGTDVLTFNTLEQVFSDRVLTNDKISSVINNTNRRITFYSEAGCKGRYLRIPPYTQVRDLNRYHFNDTISSLRG
ncbi:peptidase inhibitor family I36 protein [Nonomuraea sp. K274]|uniref:Peptidase inhibitor family I36 protein n=1 Tax=Nonomuraea cypriaca TaxID=1187855 RepID=A0A931A933_9ACTN|nr:peptidase inhibitor family I36 protein [Nonomuraea cypriaca]MBF8188521.1 peptidase inhibitor family I36 protein [Nonomuraea cypriaca]